jgi:alpha-amylase/alpha-mannosidase (GH57 family)
VQAEYSWGEFYTGTRRDLQVGVTAKPNTHVFVSLQYEQNDVSLAEGDFRVHVATLKADYNFSPNVSWANLLQYDSESRVLGVQSRFRWIIKPGSDLFLVINRGWYRNEWDNQYERRYDKGSVKLQYTFRL